MGNGETTDWQERVLFQDKIVTPCYVLDFDVLASHVDTIKKLAGDTVEFVYAMKANPFLADALQTQVKQIEVCSKGELDICRRYGIAGEKIIFSGVNKTKEDIETAFAYGVECITLESQKQYRLVKEYCQTHSCRAKALLRLTNGSQFGMDAEALEAIIREQKKQSLLRIEGIHFFSGTQKKNTEKILCELTMLDAFMEKITLEHGLLDLTLEYGAGIAVPYFEGEDLGTVYEPIQTIAAELKKRQPAYRVVLELGRFFAFSCGTYVTRVDEVKWNQGKRYVLVDGGIHQLNYYGQNMAMRIPFIEIASREEGKEKLADSTEKKSIAQEKEAEEECTICGSLCTLADVLVRKWKGRIPQEGDFLLFANAGSYSVTEAPALFLSRKLPAVYAYSQKTGVQTLRHLQDSYVLNCKEGWKC